VDPRRVKSPAIISLSNLLNTQKTVDRRKISLIIGSPRKARITQPFMDEVRIHRITPRHLRDRRTLNTRLTANLAFLVI
jgi:hypothetical protein